MGKFFTIEINPLIPASKQVATTTDEVLFDWTSFEIPKGAAKLLSLTAIVRGNNGAIQTARDVDFVFAKTVDGTAPNTLGTLNATVSCLPNITHHLIGQTFLDAGGAYGANAWDYINMGTTGSGAAVSNIPNLVLEGEPNSGSNVGYDTLYIGGIIDGAFDFGTSVLTTGAHDVSGLSAATIASLDDGSGGDALATKKFAVGDIIHATDDIILGEIASIDSDASLTFRHDGGASKYPQLGYTVPADLAAWKIQNGAGAAGDLANNDELFNVYPIKILLSFER